MEPAPTEVKHASRWAKGVSGNPSGRKKGSRNKAILALEAIGQKSARQIMRSVVQAAIEGDMQACRIIIDRLYPVRRGFPVVIDLPPLHDASDLPGVLEAIVAAATDGDISPEEASGLTSVVECYRQAIETIGLEERIKVLEETICGRRPVLRVGHGEHPHAA